METFFNLIQQVQKPGRCHRCGGCVTFCTAVNYGALELDDDGKPRYGEIEKCIECGLCAYACKARRPLLQYIMFAKKEKQKLDKIEAEKAAAEA